MTTYKRIDGDWFIQTINPGDKVYIQTDAVDIAGNLNVAGNITYINVTELNVTDPFIAVNASNTSTYSANSGLLTHTSDSTYAGIRFNTNTNSWEISSSTGANGDTGSWAAITTGATVTPGAPGNSIQFNDGGSFGGDAQLLFDKLTGQVTVGNTVAFVNQNSTPSAWPNTSVLYSNTVGSGGTGLYFVSGATQDELVSKSKAIVYSIIF